MRKQVKRKIFSALFALVLALSFSLVTATPVAAATLDVGPGETYTTIQAAIEAANTGDTINVAAGTYNEAIVVNKAVSIIGAGGSAVTIIDGAGLSGTDTLVDITAGSGTTRLEGFSLINAPISADNRFAITSKSTSTDAIHTVTQCVIEGNGCSDDWDDWGFWSYNSNAEVIFTYNTINNIGNNALLFETSLGSVTVGYNDFTLSAGAVPAIFSMSYGTLEVPDNVTTKQWIHHNSIDANGGNGIVFASAIGLGGYNERQYGKYTDVEITDNEITNVGASNKGIQLETDGDNGGFDDPLISNNSISAANPAETGTSRGIRLLGTVTNADISGNTISGFYRGIYQSGTWGQSIYATGTEVTNNDFIDNSRGIEIDGGSLSANTNNFTDNTEYGVINNTVDMVDATLNWWGHATGPEQATTNPNGLGDEVSDYVNYTPWYLVPEDDVEGEAEVTKDDFGQNSLEFEGTDTTVDALETEGTGDVTVTTGIYAVPSDATYPLPVDVTGSRALKYVDVKVSDYSSGTVTITISYTDDELAGVGVEESSLALYYFKMGSGPWTLAANSTVNTVEKTVSGDIPVGELTGTPLCLGGDAEVTGQYEVGGPPDVTVIFTPTEMDPRVEQTVTVGVDVGTGRTLAELTDVTFKLWYEGTPATPTEETFDGKSADTQTCAIITWNGTTFSIAPTGGDTTWSLGTCTAPTLTNPSGDFTLNFTPGKVATEADGTTTKWQIAATAASVYGTGFGYDGEATAMNWYGEMALGSIVSVDWGAVPAGMDFTDSAPSQASLGTTITYISNGSFDKKAKSSATWVGAINATLDGSGTCDTAQEFALMVDNVAGHGDAAMLDSTGVVFDDTGALTAEAGGADASNYLWLQLASDFALDVYTGTITYIIANGS
jgi:hypothetical protein